MIDERIISPAYRELLQRQHKETKWGSDGKFRHVNDLHSLLRRTNSKTILDFGSGRESLANTFDQKRSQWKHAKYRVFNFDPGTSANDLREADIVASCDVLEHIEPEKLDLVLNVIFGLARKGLYLVIALRQAKQPLVDGSPAHLIVKPREWWTRKLLEFDAKRSFQANADELKATMVK